MGTAVFALSKTAPQGALHQSAHKRQVEQLSCGYYEQAEGMFFRLVKQMAEREGVTEQLKVENQMEWVGRMNNIRNRAMEIVNEEIIYN